MVYCLVLTKNVKEMNNSPTKMLYDTLLCVPGMNENVKIDLRISRRMVLLMAQAIQQGLLVESEALTDLLSALPDNEAQQLTALVGDCLEKAGLTALNNKLQSLNGLSHGK